MCIKKMAGVDGVDHDENIGTASPLDVLVWWAAERSVLRVKIRTLLRNVTNAVCC